MGYTLGERHRPSAVSGYVREIGFDVLTTTCVVGLGFSGGPVFAADNGHLLGLIVGQLNLGAVNFVLPAVTFVKTIDKYVQTNGQYYLYIVSFSCGP